MAFVSRNGKVKPVKNLGWILRHRDEITQLVIEGNLTIFYLTKDVIYTCSWADKNVMRAWLKLHMPEVTMNYRLNKAWQRNFGDLAELENYIRTGQADLALDYIKNARSFVQQDMDSKW